MDLYFLTCCRAAKKAGFLKKVPSLIDFEIIDDAIALKNDYFPNAGIAVLSNASLIHKDSVFHALKKINYNILKLDTGIEKTFRILNIPQTGISLDKIIKSMTKFNSDLIIQSLFIKGEYNN